jgi:uncharacterized damage-inducible protein DinB
MNEELLARIFAHSNWANQKIIAACATLSAEQLDARPGSATAGSIRETLIHFVSSQRGYLLLLTVPLEERIQRTRSDVEFSELENVARSTGENLLALASGAARSSMPTPLLTRDAHTVEPWVVMVQVINHATEHREQIKSMLTALGVAPPDIDGWDYGWDVRALVPIPETGEPGKNNTG